MDVPSDPELLAGGSPAGLLGNAIVLIGPAAPNLVRTVEYLKASPSTSTFPEQPPV